jgi:TolB-like protein/Tfp pilus assembly protein PilF
LGKKKQKGIIHELRRRRVFKTVALYIVGAWVALQVAELALPGLNIPDFAIRYVWIAAFLLFPLVLVIGWRYDITKHGIVRTPPADSPALFDQSLKRTDHIILAVLVVIAAGIFFQLTMQISATQHQETVVAPKDIEPNTIAVLPLENLSGDPEQAYFVSGMQDVLIAGLSRISALKVTSKRSTMRFQDTTESLPRIAAQLGVARLIEGSIFRVDNRVRITVQLLDGVLDEHIWSQTFEREVEDMMMLQNEVAGAIAQQVEVTLKPDEQDQLRRAESINPAAYEAYLKGEFHVLRFTPQDIQLAAQYFQQALEINPDNALAYVGLAKLCAVQAQAGLIRPHEARERCLPPIEKALEIDDSLPEAHYNYAIHVTWLRYDWEEGEAAFQRAIDLNPSYAEARLLFAHYLTLIGRAGEGTEQMRMALELDPLNPFVRSMYGTQLGMIGDYEGCVRVIEDVMASTPGFGFGHGSLVAAYHALGENDKANAALVKAYRVMNLSEAADVLESTYAESGYSAALLRTAKVMEERSKTVHVGPLEIGFLYAEAGEVEKAIDWFEAGYRIMGPGVPYLGVNALALSPELRSNQRFIKLLRDIRLDYWADKYSQANNKLGSE